MCYKSGCQSAPFQFPCSSVRNIAWFPMQVVVALESVDSVRNLCPVCIDPETLLARGLSRVHCRGHSSPPRLLPGWHNDSLDCLGNISLLTPRRFLAKPHLWCSCPACLDFNCEAPFASSEPHRSVNSFTEKTQLVGFLGGALPAENMSVPGKTGLMDSEWRKSLKVYTHTRLSAGTFIL